MQERSPGYRRPRVARGKGLAGEVAESGGAESLAAVVGVVGSGGKATERSGRGAADAYDSPLCAEWSPGSTAGLLHQLVEQRRPGPVALPGWRLDNESNWRAVHAPGGDTLTDAVPVDKFRG